MKKVSEYLHDERIKQGYTLPDVQEATKIKLLFLKAIEEGRFHFLPSESYALGFVKQYASFLKLPLGKVSAYFRREYEGEREDYIPRFRKTDEEFKKFQIVTSGRIAIVFIAGTVAAFVFFQYSSAFFGPQIEISAPRDGEEFGKNIIKVEGTTDPTAVVTIDGDEAYVGIDGKFAKSLYVFSGDKKIIVISKNRFGKETRREVNVKVK